MNIGVQALRTHAHLGGECQKRVHAHALDLPIFYALQHTTSRLVHMRAVIESTGMRSIDDLGKCSCEPSFMPNERQRAQSRAIGYDTARFRQRDHDARDGGMPPSIITFTHLARLERLGTEQRVEQRRFACTGLAQDHADRAVGNARPDLIETHPRTRGGRNHGHTLANQPLDILNNRLNLARLTPVDFREDHNRLGTAVAREYE